MATLLQGRAPAPAQAQAPQAASHVVGMPAGPGADVRRVGDNLIGQTLGSYALVSVLGEGGMGRVYLAHHALIGRKAAIKVLSPDIAADPEAVSRFFTEARAVNDIRHPNIVEVTDFGQFGSLHCIVMEFLEGETLAARLERVRGGFDEPAVVRIMKQCTSALGAAHERGLVHRDIKPENIFLRDHPDYPDFVKVLDFGIAKLTGPEAALGHHTKTGSVIGTPAYMSPEQCLGEANLDFRSDIYSLGVVLYQMLTGRQPFTGDTLGRLIVCHVSELPVPPAVVNPSISRAMNDVVLRALQKAPKDRFQSAREMRDALDRVLAPAHRVATPIFGVQLHMAGAMAAVAEGRAGEPPGAAGLHAARTQAGAIPAGAGGRGRGHTARPQGVAAPPAASPAPLPAAPAPPRPMTPMAGAAGGDLAARLCGIALDRAAAGRITVPALPAPVLRCLVLAREGRLSFADAARIVSETPALRSRLMKLANSAAFPSLMPATTMEQAVARLGTQGLCAALLELSAHDVLQGHHPRVKEAMRRIWPHALGVAELTAEICRAFGRDADASHGYVAGLLQDAGKPLVGALLLEIEQQMQRAESRAGLPAPVFHAVIEGAHRPFSAALARAWDLLPAVAGAIEGAGAWEPSQPRALGNVLRFASTMAKRLGITAAAAAFQPGETDRLYQEGRALIAPEDALLKRVSHGFKERITVLSGIRG